MTASAGRGRLLASPEWPDASATCEDCGSTFLRRPLVCASCGGTDLSPGDLVGSGRVEAMTTVPERYTPAQEGPLTIVLVRLSQGPLLLARASRHVSIGEDVELELIPTAAGALVPGTASASE